MELTCACSVVIDVIIVNNATLSVLTEVRANAAFHYQEMLHMRIF